MSVREYYNLNRPYTYVGLVFTVTFEFLQSGCYARPLKCGTEGRNVPSKCISLKEFGGRLKKRTAVGGKEIIREGMLSSYVVVRL